MSSLRLGSLFAVLLLGSACSGESPPGVARSAIVNGERSEVDDDAVVKLLLPVHEVLCSGTLVAPNVVVTALHCVTNYNTSGMFSCDSKGVLNTSTPPDGEIGAPVDPTEIEIHLGALPDRTADAYGEKVFGTGSTIICRNDLAFVVLDRDLDGPIAPMRLARPIVRRESMRVVGYGQTEMAQSTGRYRRTGVLVSDVGSNGSTSGGNAAPNTFVLGPGACQGDSGGPALSEETGAVVGVYSLSAGISCEFAQVRNIYTQLAPFSVLVQKAFDYAGKEPIVEAPDNAGGAGGQAGATGGQVGATGGVVGDGGSAGLETGGALGTGGVLGTGGGSEATGGNTVVEGSGSRRDSSCALSVRGWRKGGLSSVGSALLVLAVAALRRRRRGAERAQRRD